MGSGYHPPVGAQLYRADFLEQKIMGKPLAARQGATLSVFVVAVAFASQGRVRVGAPAFRVALRQEQAAEILSQESSSFFLFRGVQRGYFSFMDRPYSAIRARLRCNR